MALGIALRFVLEALRKPPGSKMYMFGTTALDRFKTRLVLDVFFCNFISSKRCVNNPKNFNAVMSFVNFFVDNIQVARNVRYRRHLKSLTNIVEIANGKIAQSHKIVWILCYVSQFLFLGEHEIQLR